MAEPLSDIVHHEERVEQRDHLYGPGARVHNDVRYVLVTPDMLQAMKAGDAPATRVLNNHLVDAHTPLHNAGPSPHVGGGAVQHFEHQHQTEEQVVGQAPIDEDEDDEPDHTVNPWTKIRYILREYFGEFIGTMILIIFGNGVNCQVVLNDNTQGSYLSISFGWGIGVMFGVYICGGISGAHINPAVTLTLAIFRGFPWRKVPGYILAQCMGACMGACLIMGNYKNLLDKFEGGSNVRTYGLETSTATLFFTDTKPYMTNIAAFFSEVLATAVLLACILSLSDKYNNPAPPGMNGMILLWLIVGIGAALGTETAYCLNPARDFGPRVAASFYGYPNHIWHYRNWYWLYTPIIGPFFGGFLGGFFYDFFLYSGNDSPLNKPWTLFGRKRKQRAITNGHEAKV